MSEFTDKLDKENLDIKDSIIAGAYKALLKTNLIMESLEVRKLKDSGTEIENKLFAISRSEIQLHMGIIKRG